ncbi:bifunctional riboflavin kinase/FAD synthetase [Cryobacterium sp. TMT1-3]|uniref:Riboflavin biosynthesis protein n=1 Tax=Cryobacterium luteum TaxID=1424661 RepID=A0A1H8FTY4_9MICO|nr:MULTISPECIES: bifunctional riboflavin kinase/FAD synthetase [Cryobacterium]TFB93473.1 bifunctional riboflavin kinase/FAD synthetase [Cryobacterium luteum]TFC31728.1 bifunctional riboflavin kinase/FAD synthetase [Cryobacterium sp. TMT1-3]SEN35176.1 riboflavin kinase / FMN adenylyltransferase [Cryobacterium luteum]
MKTFHGVDSVPSDWPPSAVSIGKFDGVHAGHRAVLSELKAIAAREQLAAVVVTFDRHPLALLAPESCPSALISADQKLKLIAETGVDATLLLEFNHALSSLPPRQFIERILVTALRARFVLVGRDFRFGAKGAGDVALLRDLGVEFGYEVRMIEDVMPDGTRRVSSTWIRELLSTGAVAAAGRLLGHVPTVRGLVVHGAARGRELGFPTANLSADSEGLIPADGVYAGWLTDAGARFPAAISVGNNPTFDGVAQKQVEAYVLDEVNLDLYDHVVDVSFVERIRGMVAYSGIDPLIVQMRDDVARARTILGRKTSI